MKVLISENQLKLFVSEQISTGVQSGTYKGTTSYQYDNRLPVTPKKIIGDPVTWDKVKAKYNKNTLAQAIQWWKTWINNKTTKTKFANNWKMNMKDVESIFQKYNDILGKLKLEYEWEENKSEIAWVAGGSRYDKMVGNTTNVIYVNVVKAADYSAVPLLIHEIQHILFKIKPFHPEEKIDTDINLDYNDKLSFINWAKNLLGGEKLSSEVSPSANKTFPYVQKKLLDMGMNPQDAKYHWNKFKSIPLDKIQYLKEPTEIYSRLASLRQLLNLKPEQNITAKEIVKATKMNIQYNNDGVMTDFDLSEPGITWLIYVILASPLSVDQIINQWNSYAKNNKTNDTSDQTTNFA
jgi:hypothetical protein